MARVQSINTHPGVWYALAVARLLLAVTFLWAFFDKLLGLGVATPAVRAWVNGGSPTAGFLRGIEGPFAGVFGLLVGHWWVDGLFMLGLLCIGVALLLGIGVRIAVISGSVLLVLMWLAALPLANNPLVDDHIIYVSILVALGYGVANQKWSIGRWWRSLDFVAKNRWLW